MTNTRNTPIEVMERNYPVRIRRYSLRPGSGGQGRHAGGDGVVREFEFLAPATVTLLTERRLHRPWGLGTGQPGQPGCNHLNGKELPPKTTVSLASGDILRLETPGGGGWG
jgi:N-methylhydantoinase B